MSTPETGLEKAIEVEVDPRLTRGVKAFLRILNSLTFGQRKFQIVLSLPKQISNTSITRQSGIAIVVMSSSRAN